MSFFSYWDKNPLVSFQQGHYTIWLMKCRICRYFENTLVWALSYRGLDHCLGTLCLNRILIYVLALCTVGSASMSGRQWIMAQILSSCHLLRDFGGVPAPGFSLAHTWLLWSFREWPSWWKILIPSFVLSLCLSVSLLSSLVLIQLSDLILLLPHYLSSEDLSFHPDYWLLYQDSSLRGVLMLTVRIIHSPYTSILLIDC